MYQLPNITPVRGNFLWPIAVAFAVCWCKFSVAQTASRYVGEFSDGTRIAGNELSDWHRPKSAPHLDGRDLYNPVNPVRWLRDRKLFPGKSPASFVETIFGDRLPGRVIAFVPTNASTYEIIPAHLLVDTALTSGTPKSRKVVRVDVRFVRQIVWQASKVEHYQPQTAFYRDGGIEKYRSATFGSEYVSLLFDEGQSRVSFEELTAIHFPKAATWEMYFDELALLSPNGDDRLTQVETVDGLIATTSLSRFSATARGRPTDSSRWAHCFYPVWSLDPLWIELDRIWMRRFFAVHEIPLSRIIPSRVKQSSLLGGKQKSWRVNRNVRDSLMQSDGQDFGWGFGTYAFTELEFDLPSLATSFQSRVGLDSIAGTGGCIKARVFVNSTESNPAYESGFLVGSGVTDGTSEIPIPDGGANHRVILQVDPAHKDRPDGADPLDIRDYANWLDPLVNLDKNQLMREIQSRLPSLYPSWKEWQLDVQSDGEVAWSLRESKKTESLGGDFKLWAAAEDRPLTLRRRIELDPDDKWLLLFVERYRGGKVLPRIVVRIDGDVIADLDIPERDRDAPILLPLAVSLADQLAKIGRPIDIELQQTPSHRSNPVCWHYVDVARQLPTLYELFEDEGEFASIDVNSNTPGDVALFADDVHCGVRSVKLFPSGRFQLRYPKEIAIRKEPRWGEFRFIRFAFRKFGNGRISVELNHDQSNERPACYDAGMGEPSLPEAKRVWQHRLPSEWIVMTRDLYADFGAVDVTGLTLSSPDGNYALFDHIYLARSATDFESIPTVPSAELTNQKARRELARPILDAVLPATVAISFPDGRYGTGVLVNSDGCILTAGHVVAKPNQIVTVRLPNGKQVKGETSGIYRDLDVGMVKIAEKGPYSFVATTMPDEFPANELYVAVTHKQLVPETVRPIAHIVDIRRVFSAKLWTSFDIEDYSSGGPLVDQHGRLIGIHTRRSNSSGFLYTRINEVLPHLERLQSGDVWGEWPSGTGPMMGVEITTVAAGCKVTEVFENSSAAKSGVQENDIVTKVDGSSVDTLADIFKELTDNDPGDEIEVEIARADKSLRKTVELVPRVP